jgi:GalNAc-alpha-(1->4)-GalNAc-alpha-(1->3)-diNAcBac-PP-undecaprenol alpha-1,4-N-acetyl-D-galactosaminyltransferase
VGFLTLNSKTTPADRIAVVISSLGGGGAERVVVDLCRHLRDSGREVTLITLSGDDPDAYAVPAGVRRERMEIRRSAGSLLDTIQFSLRHLAAMRRKIMSLSPDVVVSFVDQTNVRTVLGLFGTGIPVIVSERVHPAHNPISRGWRVARRLTYPFAAAVTVQTEDGAEWFRRWTRVRHLVVISNAARYPQDLGADFAEAPTSASRPLILAIGRLIRQKGFDLLFEAFHRSRLFESGWHLTVLGEGIERWSLTQQAAKLGIAEALALPGRVDDVGRWLKRADLFVLSSRYEGFPNALMEAMQLGLPCISFDCPSGPREMIEDNGNGCLVPAEDIDGLSEALRRLAIDVDLRRRLAAEATKISDRFSPAIVYKRWLQLIDAVFAGELKEQGMEYSPKAGRRSVGSSQSKQDHGVGW